VELPVPARAVVLVCGVAWMILGPIDRQVLGRDDVIFKAWRMYSGAALEVCVADYWQPVEGGDWVELSRTGILFGSPNWWELPPHQRHLRSADAARAAARRLCTHVPDLDVRADIRCAGPRGWRTVETHKRNLCATR
jgi:hypothetical protein